MTTKKDIRRQFIYDTLYQLSIPLSHKTQSREISTLTKFLSRHSNGMPYIENNTDVSRISFAYYMTCLDDENLLKERVKYGFLNKIKHTKASTYETTQLTDEVLKIFLPEYLPHNSAQKCAF